MARSRDPGGIYPYACSSMNEPAGGAMEHKYLDSAAAADRIGVSARTLEKWRSAGEGPPFLKLGRRVTYRPADRHVGGTGSAIHVHLRPSRAVATRLIQPRAPRAANLPSEEASSGAYESGPSPSGRSYEEYRMDGWNRREDALASAASHVGDLGHPLCGCAGRLTGATAQSESGVNAQCGHRIELYLRNDRWRLANPTGCNHRVCQWCGARRSSELKQEWGGALAVLAAQRVSSEWVVRHYQTCSGRRRIGDTCSGLTYSPS